MAGDDTRPVIVQTNCGNETEAKVIAREAVAAGLAAGANIRGPVTSVYRWQGSINEALEWVLDLKTVTARLTEIEGLIATRHSYERPCILVLPIEGGEARYLDWVRQQSSGTA